jgi:nucleoside-diphosphate-sugar epimerase
LTKKILITGSEGFLGTYLKNYYLKKNFKVVGLDNLSKYESRSNTVNSNNRFLFHKVDCSKEHKILKYLKECDSIIINAANIGGIKHLDNGYSTLFMENQNIFNASLNASIKAFKLYKLKKIILISTSMIYENNGSRSSNENEDLKISYPKNFYAFQKLTSEMLLKAASKQYGFKYTIIRPFNLIGKFEDDKVAKMSHVIPELINKLKKPSKKIKIYGDGSQERSFTSVSEAAKCIYLISSKKNCENQTFNVGSEESTSITKLIKLLSKVLKTKKKLVKTKSFASDVKFNKCNSNKVFTYTAYKPRKKLEDIVRDLIK